MIVNAFDCSVCFILLSDDVFLDSCLGIHLLMDKTILDLSSSFIGFFFSENIERFGGKPPQSLIEFLKVDPFFQQTN